MRRESCCYRVASLQGVLGFALACCLLMFSGLSVSAVSALADDVYYFGWYPGDSLSMDEYRAKNFAKYLSDRSQIQIEAKKVANVGELIADLQKEVIHFASLPNYHYPEFRKTFHLLATPQYDNNSNMFLYIIANSDAKIHDLEDLKGKAAGQVIENNQLKCYFLSESLKVKPQDFLGKVSVFRNVKEAVDSVAAGKTVTTCISSTAYDILTKFDPSLLKKIKIIKRSAAYAQNPVVASEQTPESVRWVLQSTLINMGNDYAAQQILLPMGFHGFVSPISDILLYPHFPGKGQLAGKESSGKEQDKSSGAATVEAPLLSLDTPGTENTSEKEAAPSSPAPEKVAEKSAATPPSGETASASGLTPASEEAIKAQKDARDAKAAAPPPVVSEDSALQPPQEQPVVAGNVPRNWIKRYSYQVAGVFLGLLAIIVLTAINMLGGFHKAKVLTVLFASNDKVTAMQSHLDWKGKLHLQVCETAKSFNEKGVRKVLRDIGHKSAMKTAIILNSDRLVFREYSFPVLPANEIDTAIHWRLKDMNIPYNEEHDTIHSLITAKNRQKKEITVQAIVVPDNDSNANEWKRMKLGEDAVVCMEMALLNRYRQNLPEDGNNRSLLVYRLNEQEAIVLLLDGDHSFLSRRIFGLSTDHPLDIPSFGLELERETSEPVVNKEARLNPAELWKNFLPDIYQTINFYNRQSGRSLETLYLAGQEVPFPPDPENFVAEKIGIKVAAIDLLADIELKPGVREGCPTVELLAGAAMLWHKKG